MRILILFISLFMFGCDTIIGIFDSEGPNITFSYPLDGDLLFGSTKIKVDVSDEDSDIHKVHFYINDSLFFSDPLEPFSYDWDMCALSGSEHEITIVAVDTEWNESVESITVTIDGNVGYDCNQECLDLSELTVESLDSDNDGICDDVDLDADNDGCNNNLDPDPLIASIDTDLDGFADICDDDDDDDGVPDVNDSEPLISMLCSDSDLDGCDDCSSGTYQLLLDGLDTDADGLCNLGDLDDDGDGVLDINDSHPLIDVLCADSDLDGCDDCSSGMNQLLLDGTDSDGDGLCDIGDEDDDNDGVLDPEDCNPINAFNSFFDDCGICGGECFNPLSPGEIQPVGCSECGCFESEEMEDCLGECLPEFEDCTGTCGGLYLEDPNFGVDYCTVEFGYNECTLKQDLCIQDCAGEWGGAAWESDCGCVAADNSGDECDDCAGTPNGTAWESDCGCVAADNSGDECDDCAGTPNGSAYLDNCGICDFDLTNDCPDLVNIESVEILSFENSWCESWPNGNGDSGSDPCPELYVIFAINEDGYSSEADALQNVVVDNLPYVISADSFLPTIPAITNFSESEIWLKLYDDDSASGDDQIGVTNTFYLIDSQVIPEDLPVSDIPATFSSSHTISLNNGDGVLKVNFNWTHE